MPIPTNAKQMVPKWKTKQDKYNNTSLANPSNYSFLPSFKTQTAKYIHTYIHTKYIPLPCTCERERER